MIILKIIEFIIAIPVFIAICSFFTLGGLVEHKKKDK